MYEACYKIHGDWLLYVSGAFILLCCSASHTYFCTRSATWYLHATTLAYCTGYRGQAAMRDAPLPSDRRNVMMRDESTMLLHRIGILHAVMEAPNRDGQAF